MNKFYILLLSICICVGIGCDDDSSNNSNVTSKSVKGEYITIEKKATHYNVVIDYTTGASRTQAGEEYGKLVKKIFPDFEQVIDSCLVEYNYISTITNGAIANYEKMMQNIAAIKPQVQKIYRDEIEGFASNLSGGTTNVPGDGKCSVDELYVLSIMPDVLRAHACNGISVFGDMSSTGKTMTGRAFDFLSGSKGQFAKCHAMITIKNGTNSICFVGFLGNLGATSVFNEDGVFAAVLDSPNGQPVIFSDQRSYVMDLRYAVEMIPDNNTIDVIADYLKDSNKKYIYNHLILLSDVNGTKVLENDFDNNRALRSFDSKLRDGVEWNFTDAICAVNSFVLDGNLDNHTPNPPYVSTTNTGRWESFTNLLTAAAPDKVTPEELRNIMSYHGGDNVLKHIYRGQEYENSDPTRKSHGFVQHMFFVPETLELKVCFRPVAGPDLNPVYENIEVSFE